jgi:glycosyltransferase involved in cell wall biosynthesis
MITQGINGVLIPPGDVEALAAAIQQLIENPELRHRLGMAAQKKVGAYAAELIIPKFEAIYSTIASKGQ